MLPIQLREIPPDIIDYIGVIKDIQFTRQGHTSDVGIISSMQGCYVIKERRASSIVLGYLMKSMLCIVCTLQSCLFLLFISSWKKKIRNSRGR